MSQLKRRHFSWPLATNSLGSEMIIVHDLKASPRVPLAARRRLSSAAAKNYAPFRAIEPFYFESGATPGSPFNPAGPGGPADPCGPASPAGPAGPAGPTAPAGPGGPAGPWAPASPFGPGGPGGPGCPSKQPPSAKQERTAIAVTIRIPAPKHLFRIKSG